MQIVILIILLVVTSFNLKAEKYELYREHLDIGVMLNSQDYYMAAEDSTTIILPYVDIENEYIVSRGDKGIILYRAYENNKFLSMLGLHYYVPRTANMDAEGVLDGLHKVEFDLPLVWHNSIYLGKGFEFTFRIEQGIRVTSSQQYGLYFTYNGRLMKGLFMEISSGTSLGSKGYVDNWFGISEEENINNTYFDGTYEGNKLNLVNIFMEGYMYYDISYNWSFVMGLKLVRYVGDVKKSPIVSDGSLVDFAIMPSIAYKF